MPNKDLTVAHRKLFFLTLFMSILYLTFQAIYSISEAENNTLSANIACFGAVLVTFGGGSRLGKKAQEIEDTYKKSEAELMLMFDLIVVVTAIKVLIFH